MRDALDRKYPNAPKDWRWQWVLPEENQCKNQKTGEEGQHDVHESIIQKAVNGAVRKAGLARRATCHTFRHSFATQLLENGYDIMTVQEPVGHKGVKTTMIYTHVLNRGGKGVKTPWMICRAESQTCYTESIYHSTPSVADALTASIHKAYAEMCDGVLCRSFADHSCYEETI